MLPSVPLRTAAGLVAIALAAYGLSVDRGARAQDPPDDGSGTATAASPRLEVPRDTPGGPDAPVRRAIDKGLAWLAEDLTTSATGQVSLGNDGTRAPIGVTALTALAFMAGGNSPTRGPHQRPLVRTLDYLLSHVTPEGEPNWGYITASDDQKSENHGHGLAVLALTQAYTLSPQTPRGKRIASAIELGVRRIDRAQGPDGGWYYWPEPVDLTEGSVTVCMLQALRGARNAGFQVDAKIVGRAIEYVYSLQDDQGGFMYSKQQPTSSVALTGACLSTLHASGVYEGNEVEDGYLYIWRKLAIREDDRAKGLFGNESRFPFYERFYLSQSLWQHRDEQVFRRWAEDETRRVITTQRKDGSWPDRRYDARGNRIEDEYGSAYATAMNVLYLSVPEGRLPIFER